MSYSAHPSAIIEEGCLIGDGTKIWHFCHIMKGCSIGENCSLGQNVFIGSNVKLGNNVRIQNNVSVYEGVICEDDVFLGPSMVFTNVINPRSALHTRSYEEIMAGRGFQLEQTKDAISVVHDIRNTRLGGTV